MYKINKIFAIAIQGVCALLFLSCGKKIAKSEATYPNKPITIICPWGQGGGTDTITRTFAKAAQKQLGQEVTVKNITGGASVIGHTAIKDAKPDGYTVGMITFELNSLSHRGLLDFTYKDIVPVIMINEDVAALSVPMNAPYNNVDEFVQYCKNNPGEITIANSAPASVWHIGAGLLAQKTDIEIRHEAFEGAAGAITALTQGFVDAATVSLPEIKDAMESGRVKVLGVMAENRLPGYPNVKTFREQGYDIVYGGWRGFAVPKGTPLQVRQTLETAFTKAFNDADFKENVAKLNLTLSYKNSEDFESFLSQNYKEVRAVMKDLDLIE